GAAGDRLGGLGGAFVAIATPTALPRTRTYSDSLGLHRVAAELVPKGGQHLRAVRIVLARAEPGLEGERDDRRRDVVVDCLLHRPAALAGILDPALEVRQVLAVRLEGQRGELEEPRPDDRAVVPEVRDRAEIDLVVARVEDLESLG